MYVSPIWAVTLIREVQSLSGGLGRELTDYLYTQADHFVSCSFIWSWLLYRTRQG